MASLFNTLITNINGVGDRRAVLFNKLGVTTVGDLLYFFPRAYNFWNTPKEIALLQDGETCCIKAKICSAFSENYIKGTSQRFVSKTAASDASGVIELTFFNNKYIKNMLKYDEEYLFFGKVTRKLYGCEMLSPEFALPNNRNVIVPLYPGTAGLSNKQIIAAVKTALAMLPDTMQDTLPDIIREQYGLIGLKEALQQIHFPKKVGDELQARKRLAFEELLVLNLGLRQIKKAGATAPGIKISNDYTNEFIKMLPFKLTNAQQRVIAECCNDMQHKPCAMNRLIQGDVGSGKTAVAAAMCYNVVKNGFQAAFMAPTEVLAIQHFNSLKQLLEPVGITVAILTGSMPKKVKDSVRTGLHSGEIDIIIGTHALLTEDTEFANLALVITDEQHRFGVKQRAALTQKGQNPHL
ncbi:MAG: DEAD/DEAH box helicase, partial [Oscillospiraceae bacterium]|nr:DEAD/DEAH box helicase [Oscillospiraceae bacterium]